MMRAIGPSVALATGLWLTASGVTQAQDPAGEPEPAQQPAQDEAQQAPPPEGAEPYPGQEQQHPNQPPPQQHPDAQHPSQQHPNQQGPYYGPPPQHPHGAPLPHEELRPAPNSVFFEGLGAGLFYSLNYERRVIDDLGVRVGFGYVSMSAEAGTSSSSAGLLTIPITVSYLGVRGASSGLELGGGATLIYATGDVASGGLTATGSGMTAWGTAMVGYRYHPAGGAGFQFRVGAMALMGRGLSLSAARPGSFGVIPWFYLSMGAGF